MLSWQCVKFSIGLDFQLAQPMCLGELLPHWKTLRPVSMEMRLQVTCKRLPLEHLSPTSTGQPRTPGRSPAATHSPSHFPPPRISRSHTILNNGNDFSSLLFRWELGTTDDRRVSCPSAKKHSSHRNSPERLDARLRTPIPALRAWFAKTRNFGRKLPPFPPWNISSIKYKMSVKPS